MIFPIKGRMLKNIYRTSFLSHPFIEFFMRSFANVLRSFFKSSFCFANFVFNAAISYLALRNSISKSTHPLHTLAFVDLLVEVELN